MTDAAPMAALAAEQQSEAQKQVLQTGNVYQPIPQESKANPEPMQAPSGDGSKTSTYVISTKTGNPQIGPYVPYDVNPVVIQPTPVMLDVEQNKLTPELLPKLWGKLFENEQWMRSLLEEEREELKYLISGKEVEYENETTFSIIADNSYYQTRIRPYIVHLLDELRRVSGIELLNCFCKVHYNQTEAVPYSAKEKFEAMLQYNTCLLNFRQMFDEIDL